MATMYTDTNLIGRQFDWVNELGLGSKTYTNNEVRTSNRVGLPANMRWDLMVKLASGAVTVEIFNVDESTALGSADATTGAITTTEEIHRDYASVDAKRYIVLKVTAGASGCVFAKNDLKAVDLMPKVRGVFQGPHESVAGINKVPQTAGYVPVAYTSAT